MTFTFKNSFGSFSLFGFGTDGFCVCSVSGLEPPQKTRNTVSYIGEDGCFEDLSQYSQRIITLSCDVRLGENTKNEMRKAMKILSKECVLSVKTSDSEREITVNSASFTLGKRYHNYQTFVIQLICDYPHFCDSLPTECTIFKKEKLLAKDSTLPKIFSKRLSECIVKNSGDLKIYPEIVITKNDDIVRENEIKIENMTTGKSILIHKAMVMDEVVTIDVKNRRITSSIDGNILKALDIYSSLSDFWCEPGENNIRVLLGGEQSGTEIKVNYFNEYLEAI